MKIFLRKTEIIGITALALPLLILLVVFFDFDSFNRFALFIIVVSIMQMVVEIIEKEKKTANLQILKCRKFYGYSTLIISLVYCLVVMLLGEYCIEISLVVFVIYIINAFMLYRSVRNLKL